MLIYRGHPDALQVLLVHPGGPYWRRRDAGAWQIPKGAIEPGEQPIAAARREAGEELGVFLDGELLALGEVRQAGGKIVQAFTIAAEIDVEAIQSTEFEMEWPPRSGKIQSFPEVDAARWFGLEEVRAMMLESQKPLLEMLEGQLAGAA